MTLRVPLYVGHDKVGVVEISRVSNTGRARLRPSEVSRYDWYVLNGDGRYLEAGQVEHRYGDGAMELLAKALADWKAKQ